MPEPLAFAAMNDPPPPPYPVELETHSPRWRTMAAEESARLKAALGELLVTVHHIGSTAIPGIVAKPIVDLMPVVRGDTALDAAEAPVRALGYRWYGEYGLAGRRYCTLSDAVSGKRLFQLHIYAPNAVHLPRHLAFRDYLLAHPGTAKEYEAEKLRAAAVAPHDTNAYNDEKNEFIARVERQAVSWWATRPPAP